jgi:hypothetical protein
VNNSGLLDIDLRPDRFDLIPSIVKSRDPIASQWLLPQNHPKSMDKDISLSTKYSLTVHMIGGTSLANTDKSVNKDAKAPENKLSKPSISVKEYFSRQGLTNNAENSDPSPVLDDLVGQSECVILSPPALSIVVNDTSSNIASTAAVFINNEIHGDINECMNELVDNVVKSTSEKTTDERMFVENDPIIIYNDIYESMPNSNIFIFK